MKNHEKIFLIILGVSITANIIGWSLWSIADNSFIQNKRRIQTIKQINTDLKTKFNSQSKTIKKLQRENKRFESDIREWKDDRQKNNRRIENKIKELHEIIKGFEETESGNISTIDQIEESHKRIEQLIGMVFSYWADIGSNSRNSSKSRN